MNSYRNPAARWLGSPNFTPDRAGHDMTQPSWVVLHTMVTTVAGANARFQQAAQQASAHYGVGLDGSLVQWVDEKDAAWTNGNSGVEGAIGRNEDSICIEHEDGGDFDGPRTPALYAASVSLVRAVCQRYGVPIDRSHVIGHRECTGMSPTACPDALDVDRIVREAAMPVAVPGSGGSSVVTLSAARSDGTRDFFTLDGSVIQHTVFSASDEFLAHDSLPGSWLALLECGQKPDGTVFVRGYGTDAGRSVWECAYVGGWQLHAFS